MSYTDRKKAESAADRATKAQEAMSHSARIQDARASKVLCVEYDGDRKLRVTNPFEHKIRRIDLESMAFENSTTTIEYLSPLETKTLRLMQPYRANPRWSSSTVFLKWDDPNGQEKQQTWKFTS